MEKLNKVVGSRRDALKKLLAGSTFAVPVVASFAMSGLTPGQANASNSNAIPTVADWALPVLAVGLGATALVTMGKKKDA
jgi:hypothetical protein